MLKMNEINKIRKAFFSEGESINKISTNLHRSWATVKNVTCTSRKDLKSRGKRPNRKKTVTSEEVIQAVEEILHEEIEMCVKKKQRFTAKQIFARLKKNGVYHGSLRTMQATVKDLRRKTQLSKINSFLPLEFPLGSALQVDHGEVDCVIGEGRVKAYLFVASVPGKVLRFCQMYPTKASEAWGEFHEKAFRFFGGVTSNVIYDNDSVLVKKVMGRERKQTDFSLSLEEHYGFKSRFCNVAAGNEKGAVENAVGYNRRNYLAGCPNFENWDEGNKHLEAACREDIAQGKHYRTKERLAEIFEDLQNCLNPLGPVKSWFKQLTSHVDSYQLITVDNHRYSVPERYVGAYLEVYQSVFQIEIAKENEVIAIHSRAYHQEDSLDLDHYLDQLSHKPSALSDCKVVQQSHFEPVLKDIWEGLAARYSQKEANLRFIKILLLRRKYGQKLLLKGVGLALKHRTYEKEAIESMIKQLEISTACFVDSSGARQLALTKTCQWTFCLIPYTKLCKEVLR